MATNDSMTAYTGILNGTVAKEVGWQAAPHTRGTASILWNCISIIILITWTNYHPSVGTNWRQRMPTTIAVTLMPQLLGLAAIRDRVLAGRLTFAFERWANVPEWEDGWNTTKSFLVVKGGIRAVPHRRRPSSNSSPARSVNMTTNETEDETVDESADESADGIIDTETFLLLALTGRIRYKDFPTTKEINGMSKADWFSKCATLAQLFWFFINMVFRFISPSCDISAMEILVLDWIVFGLIAAGSWWKCPQNVDLAFKIPVQDHRMPAEAPPSDRDAHLAMGALLGRIREVLTSSGGRDLSGRHDPDGSKSVFDFDLAWVTMVVPLVAQLSYLLFFWGFYQWHSAQPKIFWIILTIFSTLSIMVLVLADTERSFNWGTTSIYKTYIQPLMSRPPRLRRESRNGSKWLALGRGMGVCNATDLEPRRRASRRRASEPGRRASKRKCRGIGFKLVVVAAFVALLCHVGKLVVALTAFSSAPDRIYNVPDHWLLEAFGHVGG